jgi:A/G-specific adenine glycosylase
MEAAKIRKFRTMIFSWWQTHRRDLPWRHTHDPYKILVSEVMLQQTTVRRVLLKYKEFLLKFPDIRSLQKASVADVLRAWSGMGYNRRALYLKKAASFGKIPKTEKELLKLPGVGKYTARAILIFAFRKDIAAVDTNIRQIITHFFFDDKQQNEKVIQEVADRLVPVGKSWEWHQALMDFGAIALKSRAKSRDPSKKSIPFKKTNRYFRGRIIDILRGGSVEEKNILKNFSSGTLCGLVKDGLVERKNGKIQLPDG